jgi:uncharacterized OB-fold protein
MSNTIEPVDYDRDTGPFFQAARESKLIYRFCKTCGQGIHLPTKFCGRCGSDDSEWRESTGTGTLFSWTTVTHQVHPAFPVPYTIVVVTLDDAPAVRLIGSLPGDRQLRAGQPMKVAFGLPGAESLPQWRPV